MNERYTTTQNPINPMDEFKTSEQAFILPDTPKEKPIFDLTFDTKDTLIQTILMLDKFKDQIKSPKTESAIPYDPARDTIGDFRSDVESINDLAHEVYRTLKRLIDMFQ